MAPSGRAQTRGPARVHGKSPRVPTGMQLGVTMVVRDAHKKVPRLTHRPRLPHPAAQAPTYERLLRPYVLMEPRNTKKGELAALARVGLRTLNRNPLFFFVWQPHAKSAASPRDISENSHKPMRSGYSLNAMTRPRKRTATSGVHNAECSSRLREHVSTTAALVMPGVPAATAAARRSMT